MLKELAVVHLGHVANLVPLGFMTVDVCLNDLHIGHDVNHLLLSEQTRGHNVFALVFASGKQEQNYSYDEDSFHGQSVAHIREELDAHQTHFLLIVFVFSQFLQGGLDVVGLGLMEIVEDVLLVVDIDVVLDVIVDVQVGS